MTSSTEQVRATTLLRGGAAGAQPAGFARQLAPVGTDGVGIPAEWLAGRDAGYAAGRAEALAEQAAWRERAEADADAERAARARDTAAALAALARAVDTAELTVPDVLDAAAALAVDIAEALVGHHLAVDGCAARDAVARALRDAPRGGTVVVRVNPDDAALLAGDADDLARLVPTSTLEVVADPALARGDCLAELGDRTVDARLGAALARVREVLGR